MKADSKPVLYLVIPCYNEKDIIKLSVDSINAKMQDLIEREKISKKSKIVFVNDGSKDSTLSLLKKHKTKLMKIISLSTNKGHQNALIAGLSHAHNNCDCAISLDCDLQDDINLIDEFVEAFQNGYEVVYGVRNDRKEDSFFKLYTALAFYKMMKILGVEIVSNHADYRLLSNRVLGHLLEFSEVNLFLRGIIPLLGFKSCKLYYKRNARAAGESKYPFMKMLGFAIDGITSFSIKPLRILTILGAIIFAVSLVIGIWALITYFMGRAVSGWTSMVVPMYLLGGIQLLGLGIIGEYVGKAYRETKRRPRYFVDEIVE